MTLDAKAILDALAAQIALIDGRGEVVAVNDAWQRFAVENGAEPVDCVGMNYLEVCDRGAAEQAVGAEAVGRGIRGVLSGAERRFEEVYPCPVPGGTRWFRVIASAARGGGAGAAVMHVDITESRLFEDALRENAALLRNAQRMAGLGYWHLDLPTRRMTLADETCEMLQLGRQETQLPWEAFLERVHGNDRAALDHELECVVAARGAMDLQVRFIRPDGAERWLRIRAEVMFPASSSHRVLGTVLDITERRAAGEAIRESEARHRQLSDRLAKVLDWSPEVICACDARGHFVQVSAASRRVWGYEPHELIGRSVFELIVPEDREATLESARRLRGQGRVSNVEIRVLRKDGSTALMVWSGQWSRKDRELFCVGRDETHSRLAMEANLRLSQQLHATLENMPDGFFTMDREYRITYANRAAEGLAGLPREDIVGRSLWQLFPLAEHQAFRDRYDEAYRSGVPAEFEEWAPGMQRWLGVRAVPGAGGMGVYFRDVTERRRVEASLRASEERFERVAQVTTDAIWDWDLVTGELWWSRGFTRIFGYRLETQVTTGDFWTERIHPDDRAAVIAGMHDALDSGATEWACDYRFRRADGSYAWVSDKAYIVRADGAAIRMVGGFSDVTGQRLAHERLTEQAQLLDKARDAIHVRELDHRIVYLNRAAEDLYGWSSDEARGWSIETLVYRDSTAFRRAHQELLAHGEWSGGIEVVSRDGRRRRVETRWTLLRDAAGKPRRILAIDTDVTERRELEQQVIRSQRLDSIGTLAGGIAHDLNNVFTPIVMAVNLMRGTDHGPEGRALLDAIATSAERGVQMVGRLLSFARGAEGERKPVRLADVVAGVLRIASETFPKDVTVESDLESTLPAVMGDATQLHQVLLNLCVNARDAMPRGGTIRITASRQPRAEGQAEVVVEVADTGLGITPEHLERLWDPFFTTKVHGTGLGLPTSLAIVKAHGGTMHVRSAPGEGSTFTITLPAGPEVRQESGPAAGTPVPTGNGERILVVDDEEPVRRICRQALERHGYQVTEAADGREALQAYRRDPRAYDLVLVDMMMPVMDGAQTIEALRQVNPSVRIVPTSGYAAPDRMAAVQAANMPHFLAKPYTPETLLRVVAAGLRGG